MASTLNSQAALQFLQNETNGGGGINADVETILKKVFNEQGLVESARTSKLDGFATQNQQDWCQHSQENIFQPNAQLATPVTVGSVVYSTFSPNYIDPTSIKVECEFQVTATAAITANDVGILNNWGQVAPQVQIRIGVNRTAINSLQGADATARALVGVAQRFSNNLAVEENKTNITDMNAAYYEIDGISSDNVWHAFVPVLAANGSATYKTVVKPQSEFFRVIKFIPPNTPIELTFRWTRNDLDRCVGGVTAAGVALLPDIVPAFRVVSIRADEFIPTPAVQDEISIPGVVSDQLAIGVTNFGIERGQEGPPNLMSEQALSSIGKAFPYQFPEFQNYLINPLQITGGLINFGVLPNKGRPRRIYIFPTVTLTTDAARAQGPEWCWDARVGRSPDGNPANNVQFTEINVLVGGTPIEERRYPVDKWALVHAQNVAALGYYDSPWSRPFFQSDRVVGTRPLGCFIYDLSYTRDNNEIERPNPQTVSISARVTGNGAVGVNVVCEYDQAAMLNMDRTVNLLSII